MAKQESLFPLESIEMLTRSIHDRQAGDWLLTHATGLRQILSTGFIMSASLQSRSAGYFPDLGAHCPRWLPLLRTLPSRDLVERSFSDPAGQYPVLLKLTPPDLDGYTNWPIRVRNGKRLNEVARLVEGVLPAHAIESVVFRSQTERDDFISRALSDIDFNALKVVTVEPSRFEGALAAEGLLQELDQAHRYSPEEQEAAAAKFQRQIKAAGLLCIAARIRERRTAERLSFARWTQGINALQPSTRDVCFDLTLDESSLLSIVFAAQETIPEALLESVVLHRAVWLLLRWRKDDFSAVDLLEQVFAPDGVNDIELETLRVAATHVRQNISSPQKFLEQFPQNQYPVSNAVTGLIFKHDPVKLAEEAINAPLGPYATVAYIRALLIGLLVGRQQMPLDALPSRPMQDAIARMVCAAYQEIHSGASKKRRKHSLRARFYRDEASETIILRDELIYKHQRPHPFAQLEAYFANMPEPYTPEWEELALEVCEIMDWPDCCNLHIRATSSGYVRDVQVKRVGRTRGVSEISLNLAGIMKGKPETRLDVTHWKQRMEAQSFDEVPTTHDVRLLDLRDKATALIR